MTDTTVERDLQRWADEQAQLRRAAQRFADLCARLSPLLRPNETPEEAVTRLGTP